MSASPSITVIGCVPVWMGVFHHCDRMCSCLDGCALLTSRSDVSVESLSQMIVVVSYHAGECECWALLTSKSDVSAGEDLHGGLILF